MHIADVHASFLSQDLGLFPPPNLKFIAISLWFAFSGAKGKDFGIPLDCL